MVLVAAFVLVFLGRIASAAMVYSEPLGITTQPTDDPRWNATVQWLTRNGSGEVIGSHYFLSAQHLNASVGNTISLTTVTGAGPITNTQTYTTTAVTNIPNTDLAVWKISGTFPSSSIVPLYNQPAGAELAQPFSMLGYGPHVHDYAITTTTMTGSIQNGWHWGGNIGINGEKNFGTNTVGSITNDGVAGSATLVYAFTTAGGSQAIVGPGDSGGGVFINVGGTEELAAVQYAVIQFYTAPIASAATNAAIYDATGLYVFDGTNFVLASSLGITSQYGYASEIAPYLTQIQAAMVPEPGSDVLTAFGIIGLAAWGWRRRKHRTGRSHRPTFRR